MDAIAHASGGDGEHASELAAAQDADRGAGENGLQLTILANARNPCYTDPVRKNLTLTIDAAVLKAARKIALHRDTSVNELVREYLGHLVREEDPGTAASALLRKFFRANSVTIGKRNWTRDDLHARG